jgi:DNA-binding response OmpR family regulator
MAAKKRILIAEDEKPLSHALELKLSFSGFDITVVNNGDDAVSTASKEDFDLILLDIVMPGKNGFEVLEELKKIGKKIPVIMLSNLSQQEDIEKAKQLGAVDFFIKSDTPLSDIVTMVKKRF